MPRLSDNFFLAGWDKTDTREPDVQSTSVYFPRPQVVPFIVDRDAGGGQPWQGIDGVASHSRKYPRRGRHLQVDSRDGRPMVLDRLSMLVFSPAEQRYVRSVSPRCFRKKNRNTFCKDREMAVLQQGAAVALRLSLIPGMPDHSIRGVLSRAVECLQHLEITIHLYRLRTSVERNSHALPLPPHRAQGLHDVPTTNEPLQRWGEVVEQLWRVAMSLNADGMHTRPWVMLTTRLVVWRALVGEEASRVGEWARKEVLLALRDAT